MGREFREIKGHLGFGMMRLPMNGDEIDNEAVCAMVDKFIDSGFNYFDTAHGYHDGKSEVAVRECLTSRHDRSEYLLTDKLTDEFFKSEEDIRPLIQLQLDTCGVEYFDFLLMHAQNKDNFEYFKKCRAYETAFDLKKEGKVRHVGLSFHDHPSVLDQILTEYPEIEVVQIQFNYLDYESLEVESRKVYEVCRKHLRFAAGFEGMEVVLSGMSNMQQMEDNLKIFSAGGEEGFLPFSEKEFEAVSKVAGIFNAMGVIPCTQCRYCIEENHCPMEIRIPSLFSSYNRNLMFNEVLPWMTYEILTSEGHGKASDCIQCGMCEGVCPQHLEIRDLLVKVADQFE